MEAIDPKYVGKWEDKVGQTAKILKNGRVIYGKNSLLVFDPDFEGHLIDSGRWTRIPDDPPAPVADCRAEFEKWFDSARLMTAQRNQEHTTLWPCWQAAWNAKGQS